MSYYGDRRSGQYGRSYSPSDNRPSYESRGRSQERYVRDSSPFRDRNRSISNDRNDRIERNDRDRQLSRTPSPIFDQSARGPYSEFGPAGTRSYQQRNIKTENLN